MKRALLILVLAAGALGGGALLVAWSGLIPIAPNNCMARSITVT